MKIFSKLYVWFQRKLGNKYHNLLFCSFLQSVVVVCKFTRSTVLFQCHSENTWPTLMALWHGFHWFAKEMYIQLIPPRFEGLLLDWLIFILYQLQFACYSKYSAKTTNFLFLNLFLDFLHPLV